MFRILGVVLGVMCGCHEVGQQPTSPMSIGGGGIPLQIEHCGVRSWNRGPAAMELLSIRAWR